jgi:hypothetical protein
MKKPKPPRPPKLTDAERHRRFVEVGRTVGASEKIDDFDKAFDNLSIKSSPVAPSKQAKD